MSSAPNADAAPVLAVVGAGPGVGAAVARRFAREGYAVGLIARTGSRLEDVVAELIHVAPLASVCPVAVHQLADHRSDRGGTRRREGIGW